MTPFFKLSGSGNDFIALPEVTDAPGQGRIRAWCRRGISLGADGLFVLRREAGGVEMAYWNADGLPADLCLNGTRCAARLAFELGWADGEVRVRTGAGTFTARPAGRHRVALELPAPEAPRSIDLRVEGTSVEGFRLTVGVPHLVLPWPELESAPVASLGAALRMHEAFAPAGTNVNFVRFPEEGHPGRLEIRTYERGVEAETLSCGTGVLAAVRVGLELGRLHLPVGALTRGGFELEVAEAPSPGCWSLAGDARVVARGELLAGAEEEPVEPARGGGPA